MKFCFFLAVLFLAPLFSQTYAARSSAAANDELSSGDKITAYLKSAERSLKLQTEIPKESETIEPTPEPSRFGEWIRDLIVGLLRTILKSARIILIVSIIIIAAVILLNLKGNLWSSSKTRKFEFAKSDTGKMSAAAERMEHSQAEADELARSGSFAEAMHILLLRGVNEMLNRLASPIAASLTSREILKFPDMSPEERDAFARIVGDVEISRFGTHNPGESEYLECRRNFDVLADLLKGRTR